ncbi:MAG: hypothetical protein WCS50_05655 [Bacilli bacterium]
MSADKVNALDRKPPVFFHKKKAGELRFDEPKFPSIYVRPYACLQYKQN